MAIIETDLTWNGTLSPFTKPIEYIVLHHAAGSGSLESVHNYHKNVNGWLGIAYHLYVRPSLSFGMI